jgi:hypothetical protein
MAIVSRPVLLGLGVLALAVVAYAALRHRKYDE